MEKEIYGIMDERLMAKVAFLFAPVLSSLHD